VAEQRGHLAHRGQAGGGLQALCEARDSSSMRRCSLMSRTRSSSLQALGVDGASMISTGKRVPSLRMNTTQALARRHAPAAVGLALAVFLDRSGASRPRRGMVLCPAACA
jgi:hypothetical protein